MEECHSPQPRLAMNWRQSLISEITSEQMLVIGVIGIALLAVPAWAIADAASRPTSAFKAAGSSKAMWISLVAVLWLVTWFGGLILGIVYLSAIRPRIKATSSADSNECTVNDSHILTVPEGTSTTSATDSMTPAVHDGASEKEWWQGVDGRWNPPVDGKIYGLRQTKPRPSGKSPTPDISAGLPAAQSSSPPAKGWYFDPSTEKNRWWDGRRWGPTAPD